MGIKLNAQVMIKNLHHDLEHAHEKSLPPTGARSLRVRRMPVELEYQDWARLH